MNPGPLGIRQVSKRPQRGTPLTAKLVQTLIDNQRAIEGRLKGRPSPVTGPGFLGSWVISQREQGRIFVGLGRIHYTEVAQFKSDDPTNLPPPRFIEAKIPKLDGVPLDSEERPYFEPGEMENGTVWLVCQCHRCTPSDFPDEPERVMLTEKHVRPDLEDGEVAIEIASFDLEEVEGSEIRKLTNLEYGLRDDWSQPYLCDGNFNDSDDDFLGSDSNDSNFTGSLDSGGSSDDGEEGEGCEDCKVRMSMRWLNKTDCFPKAPSLETGVKNCTPGRYVFELNITFTLTDPFDDKACPDWAFGVSLEGGYWINPATGEKETEAIWLASVYGWNHTVKFVYDAAPACSPVTVRWRARGFGPLKDANNEVIPSCCGCMFSNTFLTPPMPPVCGCGCSSSSDLDGDGIPNEEDSDIDGDGWGNVVDGDVDGDGLLDDVDSDIDGDGIPNEEDPTPEGVVP